MLLKFLTKHKYLLSFAVLALSIAFIFGSPAKASAEWVDANGTPLFLQQSNVNGFVLSNPQTITDLATNRIYRSNPPGYGTEASDENATYTYFLVNPDTNSTQTSQARGSCPGAIALKNNDSQGQVQFLNVAESGSGCNTNSTTVAYTFALGTTSPETGSNLGAGSGDDNITCETSGSPLNWILCPIFNGVADMSDWLFRNILEPFLYAPPIDTDPSKPSYQVWSNFRLYGNIILIIALLVIVFGQAIGGGLIDAYTAKKIMPRILLAAILINLSIYIVGFLVDVSNILGKGIGDILLAPFKSSQNFSFSPGTGQQLGVFGVGILGAFLGAAGISGFILAMLSGAVAVKAFVMVALFTLVPVILAIIGVFLTLIIRRGIILFLVLVAPVAFALYCLPNTEKYFQKWWDLLFKTLLVYPIVVAIFAIADIMSLTILDANNVNLQDFGNSIGLDSATQGVSTYTGNVIAIIAAFVLQFLPLALVPFSFKFAGGLVGSLYSAVTNGAAKVNGLAESRKQTAKRDWSAQTLQSRQRMMENEKLKNAASRRGLSGFAARTLRGRVGGYNIEAAMSAQRAEYMKEINDQIATGKDEEIRGLSVNKKWALAQAQATQNADGTWTDGQWRVNEGKRQFKTLGGAWIDETDVDAGHARWGGNTFAQQASLAYEMRKAQDEGQLENLATNYSQVAAASRADGGWGMNEQQAYGAWIGAAFEHQNQHLEFKYTDWKDGSLKKSTDFVNEVYEKKGSYTMAQMGSHTIEKLKEAHEIAVLNNDVDTQQKVAAIAETFMHEMGSGTQVGQVEEGPPVEIPGQPGRRQASTPGAAHVAERVRELASITGVARNLDTGAAGSAPSGHYVDPDHAPTPNRREQK